MLPLQEPLKAAQRIPALDGLRAIAILSVICFHYDFLPYGFLGVDLFFVLSGFLVSQPILESVLRGTAMDWRTFYFRRITKILPSYLVFLLIGALLSGLLYGNRQPSDVVQIKDLSKYLFFYYNYRGQGAWTFAHLWSICVEIHFYILLPLVFIMGSRWLKQRPLFFGVVALLILGSWASRLLGFKIGFETMAASHNRMDSLAFGVLLAGLFQIGFFKYASRAAAYWGLIISVSALLLFIKLDGSSDFFDLVIFHTLAALALTGVVGSVVALEWRSHAVLNRIAAISFNWYLWHVIPLHFFKDLLGTGPISFLAYFLSTLFVAVLATRWIENPGLGLRRSLGRNGHSDVMGEPVLSTH